MEEYKAYETYETDEQGRITIFNEPVQVKFIEAINDEDMEDVDYIGGIGYSDHIICGCCGAIIPLTDLYEGIPDKDFPIEQVIIPFDSWVDISDEIIGE